MRVAIEAASLGLSSGGLARYTSELSMALAGCFPDDEFFLLSDQPFRMPESAPANLKRGGGPRNAAERRWWIWGMEREMRRLGIDIVHGPDFSVPYIPRRPSVLTLHDLSPWMDPRWHHAAKRVRHRTPLLLDLGIATMVITPGDTVRRQAIERFHLQPDRVVAVPEAPAPWLRRVAPPPRPDPYFLFVGTLEPRKNLTMLVDAWREVRRSHSVDLILAGRKRADAPSLAEETGLYAIGEIPDEKLAEWYSGALALVYPSLYEGFGLPVVEAMQCGTPVIASSAVAEAGGDAAVYADDTESLRRSMLKALEEPGWSEERSALSLARAHEFSWETTARRTRDVYLEARRRFGN
ncbi:MAG TPA: glycosyltransferase family 1 protein [Bryobacteraceae bacterium]|nr:glycosyltransferase family 1 protein [Bryobacteraceae bacterium]